MKDRTGDRIEFLNSDSVSMIFDLSRSGVATLSRQAKNAGTVLKVELNDLVLDATVVYSQERTDGYRIGLHFENVSPEKQSQIDVFVDNFSRGVPVSCRIADDIHTKA